jgi:heme-degrading monooxygenase HmoA
MIWQFDVGPERLTAFETAYGPAGDWAQLFARADGFLGIELLRSEGAAGRYLTIDRWTSEAAFDAFKAAFAAEYEVLDERFEQLTQSERYLGAFTTRR